MRNLQNFKNKKIFFVGIGGVSMSAIALFCDRFGAIVSGADICENLEVKKLKNYGIRVDIGHNEKNVTEDVDFVVYSGAIKEDNVELVKARRLNIPCMERSEFLGVFSRMYERSIVVSGTHGKTTTTAMLGDIFIKAGLHPSIHLGGESVAFGNSVIGNFGVFLTEGCEYRNSIKYLSPTTSVITAIELDHTDYYQDLQEVEDAFLNLANNTTENVVVFDNIEFAKKITAKVNVINVGFGQDFDVRGLNLQLLDNGCYSFDVYYNGYVGTFRSNVVGLYNAQNMLCAVAVALLYDIDVSTIYNSCRNFLGVRRRFEKVGVVRDVPIICDYAHHPTEIKNSINTATSIYGRITVIFQPHTYSRTIGLKKAFVKCFSLASNLAIFKTYPAREKYIAGGSAKELFNSICHNHKVYIDNRKALKEYLCEADLNNCVLVLGAGDIYEIVKKIIKK